MARAARDVDRRPRRRELERELGIGPDQTTEDLKFTVKTVNCVGACAMAPVVIVGEKYHGKAKATRVDKMLRTDDA